MSDGSAPPRRAGGDQRIPRPTAWRLHVEAGWALRPAPTAVQIADAVSSAGLDAVAATPTYSDAQPSAVLIALIDGPGGAEILFTKRSKELRTHSGEISFPGGRIDAGESPVQAAVREAHEEVGLDPNAVEVRGRLSAMSTVVSRSHIIPIVATVTMAAGADRPTLVAHDREVSRIFWVPVAELIEPDTFREEWWGTPPLDRRMTFFELDDETIWGVTANILYELLSIVYGPPAVRTAP